MPDRSWEWGDPAMVYERKEARTCKGCRHLNKFTFAGTPMEVCEKGSKTLKRCKNYKERE